MPSRGTYQITSREEGKIAERDQSYRSCIITLLIFFLLCLVLILACLPWKIANREKHGGGHEDLETAKHHGTGSIDKTTTITTSSTPVTTTTSTPNIITSTYSTDQEKEYLISNRFLAEDEEKFERYSRNLTTEIPQTINSSTETEFNVVENNNILEIEKTQENRTTTTEHSLLPAIYNSTTLPSITNKSEINTTERSERKFEKIVEFTKPITINATTEMTTKREEKLYDNVVMEEISTVSTEINEVLDSTSDSLLNSKINKEITDVTDTIETTPSLEYFTENDNIKKDHLISSSTQFNDVDSTSTSTEFTNHLYQNDISSNMPTTMEDITSSSEIPPTSEATDITRKSDENEDSASKNNETDLISTTETTETTESIFSTIENICDTGYCKQISSKMLSYMNHSADPCEEFYEYACGGMEADPQIIEKDLKKQSYQRIAQQMKRSDSEKAASFLKYYNSCMQYETTFNYSQRIQIARKELSKIGKFYTSADWPSNFTGNVTDLIARLLLHHSALLFDVVLDVDDDNTDTFTLRIGPSTYKSPFVNEEQDDTCYTSETEMREQYVDLGKLYMKYDECKNDTKSFIKSISEALTELGVFNELNNTYNVSQYISSTIINVDMEIMKGYFALYPPKNVIREAYLTRAYTNITFADLGSVCNFVNWTQLILTLTGFNVVPQASLQVYFFNEMINGLNNLKEFNERQPMQFNNALLALYARDIYYELVVPKIQNRKEYCLRVATKLLVPEASYLYMSSFSDDELDYMNETITEIFDELKQTFRINVEKAEWIEDEGREVLLEKIDDIKLILPDPSNFQGFSNIQEDGNMTVKQTTKMLSDSYFENSIYLMHRYRKLMYERLKFMDPGTSKQIWAYYATPFQTKASAIYNLNMIVIPFGIVDWSAIPAFNSSINYLTLATIGKLIAHEIVRHFDANGTYYWEGKRDTEYSMLNENEFTNSNFNNYINCHKNVIYHQPVNITLPDTQVVSFKIPQLTLNERLSETAGLRLAYDTFNRLSSSMEYLPWFSTEFNTKQLFYIAYAQMYCSKTPLTSSYVSLYEEETLPSRIRIYVSSTIGTLLGESWDCPDGSQIKPSFTCDVFPHLSYSESDVTPE